MNTAEHRLKIGTAAEIVGGLDANAAATRAAANLAADPGYYSALIFMGDHLESLAKALSDNVQIGPRGGRYYVDKNGEKQYLGDETPGARLHQPDTSVKEPGRRPDTKRDKRIPPPGTEIHKEIEGRGKVVVSVTPTGFVLRGKEYTSLASVSQALTGDVKPLSWWGLRSRPAAVDRFLALSGSGAAGLVPVTTIGMRVEQQPPFASGVDYNPDKARDWPTESIPVDKMIATQPMIEKNKVAKFMLNPDLGADNLPVVVHSEGKYYIIDGHHRAAAVAALGEKKTLKAHVIDLAGQSPEDVASLAGQKMINGVRVPPNSKVIWVSKDPEGNESGKVMVIIDKNGKRHPLYGNKRETLATVDKTKKLLAMEKHWSEIYPQLRQHMQASEDNYRQKFEVLNVIERTGMRIGDTADDERGVYGASSLLARHIQVKDGRAVFDFIGKHRIHNHFEIDDPEVVAAVSARLADTTEPYDRLWPNVTDSSVRDSMGTIGPEGLQIHPKDLRMRMANIKAKEYMAQMPAPTTRKELEKAKKAVAKKVAADLGNTPAVALQYYILPIAWEKWEAGVKDE